MDRIEIKRLKHCAALSIIASSALVVSGSGQAETPIARNDNSLIEQTYYPYFIRLGYGYASYRTTGRASIFGTSVEDAKVAFGGESLGLIEGGWRITPSWSASILSGLPPTASLYGQGAFADYGLLRKVSYATVVGGLQYHPFGMGRFDPYIGVGLDYTYIRRTYGGSLSELRVSNGLGPVLQAGVEVRISDRISLYADIRKVWLSFDSKGTIPSPVGQLPVRVHVDPDPITSSFGLSYRF
ncbi:MAG: OmpW family protein [Pseudomonas sp.]|nr:MAG: OmpW family protein [Pseudomonas sp.]